MTQGLQAAQNKFKDKKITLMGLGLLGRGLGDALFLAKCGARLTVTDLKTAEQLKTSLNKLKKYPDIKFVLGEHRLEDFQNADFIFKAAGVPNDSPYITEARKNNIPILMSTAVFAQMSGAKIIAVTGTRGKTTTTQTLYEILRDYYANDASAHQSCAVNNPVNKTTPSKIRAKNKNPHIWLGGNVVGMSTLALLSKVRPTDIVVLELDSWQLQGFGDLKISPQVAVFTSFMPDHLNYYHGDLEAYFQDKANIFKFQNADDVLIAEKSVAPKIQDDNSQEKGQTYNSGHVVSVDSGHSAPTRARLIISQATDIPSTWQLRVPGAHNRANLAGALAAARALGVPDENIEKSLKNFSGVAGRLELRGTFNGIKIYNDTTATTPTATLAALRALTEGNDNRKIILIMGGSDKQLDATELIQALPQYCRAAVLLAGTGSDKIEADFLKLKRQLPVKKARTLKTALKKAMEQARAGDIVLFSPAFASFGMFKNEYDRGDKFNRLLDKIKMTVGAEQGARNGVGESEKIVTQNISEALTDFAQIKKVFFFGIGGIGVSAVARWFLAQGKEVSGCDLSPSEITEALEAEGAKIINGQKIDLVPTDADLIIYSTSIQVAAPELFAQIQKLAQKMKISALSYPEALGVLTRGKKTIAVAGTAGKTTVTAMLAEILIAAGLNPTVIIGSLLAKQKTNFLAGGKATGARVADEYFLLEADEYRRAFLNLHPYILVINNIDLDHLDYYHDLADIQSAYHQLALQVAPDGVIVVDNQDPRVAPVIAGVTAKIMDYTQTDLGETKLKVPGEHNRQNARAALAAAEFLGVKVETAKQALAQFAGAWRRFEYKGETASGAPVYDDYAHNPQKVAAAIAGAKEMYPDKKIIAVFQPHMYSRTQALLPELARSLAAGDEIILLPIYAAREAFDPAISSEILAEEIKKIVADDARGLGGAQTTAVRGNILCAPDFDTAQAAIEKSADKNSVVLIMTAGDAYVLAERVARK